MIPNVEFWDEINLNKEILKFKQILSVKFMIMKFFNRSNAHRCDPLDPRLNAI
jgi:hypothetical protein